MTMQKHFLYCIYALIGIIVFGFMAPMMTITWCQGTNYYFYLVLGCIALTTTCIITILTFFYRLLPHLDKKPFTDVDIR